MGLLDKVKGILFDETEEDENIEQLPKRVPKKTKTKQSFVDFDSEEDTIKEVKVDYSKDNEKSFQVDNFEPVSRTRSGFHSFDDFDEPVKEVREPIREAVREVPVEHTQPRASIQTQVPHRESSVREVPQPEPPKQRSRYELPPKKEVVHETRDYRKILDNANQNDKKPFVVTPIISPVYGIIDKNYKPEEIVEKNKTPQIDQVRNRMFGPVSYSDESIPEPIQYEESNETLTEKLIQENQRQKELEEETKVSEFDDFDTKEVEINNSNYVEEEPVVEEEKTSPSLDISDLISEAESTNFDTKAYDEDYFKAEPVDYEPEEEVEIKAEPRKGSVKESLDDTIETDLFNLIDSMYKTDERE